MWGVAAGWVSPLIKFSQNFPRCWVWMIINDSMCNSVQYNHWPRCKLQVNLAKKMAMGQAEQDANLPRSARNILGKVQSHLCLTEWRGRGKCRRDKSILGAACPAQKIMFCNLCCSLCNIFAPSQNYASVGKLL